MVFNTFSLILFFFNRETASRQTTHDKSLFVHLIYCRAGNHFLVSANLSFISYIMFKIIYMKFLSFLIVNYILPSLLQWKLHQVGSTFHTRVFGI